MLDLIKKYKIGLIFLIFFLIVFIQHQFVFLYHDDYGYASLSYLSDFSTNNNGYHATISQIFNFLIYHYNHWGGRVLYFFVECFLLSFGLYPIRFVQSLVITGIFYLIYKIVSDITKYDDWKIALASVMCYGIFEIMIIRGGIFWFTASVLYMFPLLPFLAFMYFYSIKKKRGIWFNLLNVVLIFISSFSQEQIAAMVVAYIGLITLYEFYKNKKVDINNIVMCISSICGFLILMLSPGSKMRMDSPTNQSFYNLSLFGKLKKNIPEILFNNFGIYTRIFTILFFTMILYISYKVFSKKIGKSIFNKISLLSNSLIFGLSIFSQVGYFEYLYNYMGSNIWKLAIMLIFMVQLLLIIYSVALYLYDKKQIPLIALFLACICSQLTMLVAPYFPLRSAIMFEFGMFVLFVYVFINILDDIKNKKIIKFITIPICLILLLNFASITKGYMKNYKINRDNDRILRNVNKNTKKIKLRKLNDDLYSCDQPYMDGFDYITIYMKKYYELSDNILIYYE